MPGFNPLGAYISTLSPWLLFHTQSSFGDSRKWKLSQTDRHLSGLYILTTWSTFNFSPSTMSTMIVVKKRETRHLRCELGSIAVYCNPSLMENSRIDFGVLTGVPPESDMDPTPLIHTAPAFALELWNGRLNDNCALLSGPFSCALRFWCRESIEITQPLDTSASSI